MNYWFFRIFNREVYIDIKKGRPLSFDIHKDKSTHSVSIFLWMFFILISSIESG